MHAIDLSLVRQSNKIKVEKVYNFHGNHAKKVSNSTDCSLPGNQASESKIMFNYCFISVSLVIKLVLLSFSLDPQSRS